MRAIFSTHAVEDDPRKIRSTGESLCRPQAGPVSEAASWRRYACMLGFAALVLPVLFWTSRENYLLFHGIVELLGVAVAWGVFLLVWNARRFIAHDAFAFLGLALFSTGWLDLLHTLAYKGMGVLAAVHDANPATQLWIAARILAISGFLAFPLLIGRRLRLPLLAAGYGCATILAAVSILAWKVFPDCFVEGRGLTPFKRVAEYLICMALAVGLAFLWRRRDRFEPWVFRGLAGVFLVTIASELCFTLYSDVYGVLNFTGHILKLLSVYLLYRSLIQASLTLPYVTLFRELDQDHRGLKKVEAELRQSEERYRLAVASSSSAVWEWDFPRHVVSYSPRWYDLRGRSPEQGWKPESEWSDGIHPDDRGRVLRAVEAHFSDASKAFREEYRVSHADGHWVWIRDCGIAQWDGGGQVVRMVGWEEDISSRMQAEESVRASETLFRNLFDLHAAVKLLIDPETGAIVDANRAAVTYYGWSRDEICRMRIQEINMLSPDEVAREMQKAKEAHRNYFEFRHRRADGSIRDVAVFSSNVAGQGKSLLHSIVHDITEQKQADAALHAMLDEKTALLKEVHHRVKNNLQVVASLLGMQARRLDNAAARNVLRDSQSRVLSMALLHELLYRTGSLAHVDFDSYTERLCAALLRTVGPVAQRVRIERSVGDIRLPLEQAVPCGLIINELVTNALKHGYPDDRHGRVCIEMKVEDHRIRLRVSDDGAGLPDGLDINALPTLGLRLVQDLARQLQGAYRMERREGAEGGTAVSVVFPVKGWQDAGGST